MTQLEAYIYATGVVMCSAIYTFTHHPYFFGVMHLGMKIRVASCSLLYRLVYSLGLNPSSTQPPPTSTPSEPRKALKLSNSALGQTTVGQMVNLLSNDVNRCNNDSTTDFLYRFDLSVLFNHYLWCGPLQLVIVTVLLYQRIGPSSLVVGLLSPVSPHILSRGWCCW